MAKGKGKKYEFVVSFGGKVDSSLAAAINGVQGKFNSLQNLAKRAAVGVGAAFAAVKVKDFVGDSINTYKNYEQSMAQTPATAGIQKGSAEYEKLNEAARAAGKATSKTAAEAADALGYMALAGWNVKQSTAALMPVLRLSEGTQADLATTSDLVTDSMSALGIKMDSEGKNLTRYLDVIAAANNKSNQTAMQAMEAYISVGGTFESLNTPIEESAALLGVLANRGTKASEAGTSMNSILINLKKKSGESAKAMKALNLSAYDSQGEFKGVTNVLKELDEKLKSLSTDEERDMYKDMIAGKTQVDTLNKLLQGLNTFTDDGVTELEALQRQLENSDGALNAMADTVSNTIGMAFSRLSSATDDFKIEFISHFESEMTPAIDRVANKITEITPKMGKVMEKVKHTFSNSKKIVGAFLSLIDVDTSILELKFFDKTAKKTITRVTGLTTNQIESLTNTFTKAKNDIVTAINITKTAINGIIHTIQKVTSFTSSHLDSLLPIIIGLNKAFLTIKFTTMIVGAIKTARAFTLLTAAKMKDKIETIYLQTLYAKDAFVNTVIGAKNAVKAFALLTAAKVKEKVETIYLHTLYAKDAFFNTITGAKNAVKAIALLTAAKVKEKVETISLQVLYAKDAAIKGISTAATWAQTAATTTWSVVASGATVVTTALGAAFRILTGPIGIVITIITGLITVGVYLYKNWDTIKQKAIELKESIITKVTELSERAKTIFINMKNSVISTVTELWTNVKTTFGNLKDSVITKATELWEGVKSVFGNIRDSIAGAFTGAVNTAIGGLNTLINKVNSVHINIPDWIPGVGGKEIGLNIPQVPTLSSNVPALASGGIVTKPTLAMIGEGNEKEAVFPLSKLEEFLSNYGSESTNNTGMVFQIEYKPQIIIQGNGKKEEIQQEVEKGAAKAQADFETQMNQWLKAQKRRGFA